MSLWSPEFYCLSLHDALPILFFFGRLVSDLNDDLCTSQSHSRQGNACECFDRVFARSGLPGRNMTSKLVQCAPYRMHLAVTYLDRKSTRLNSSRSQISYAVVV